MTASGGVVVTASTPRNTPAGSASGFVWTGQPGAAVRASSARAGSATKPAADPAVGEEGEQLAAAAPVVEVGAGAEVAADEPDPAAQPSRRGVLGVRRAP